MEFRKKGYFICYNWVVIFQKKFFSSIYLVGTKIDIDLNLNVPN